MHAADRVVSSGRVSRDSDCQKEESAERDHHKAGPCRSQPEAAAALPWLQSAYFAGERLLLPLSRPSKRVCSAMNNTPPMKATLRADSQMVAPRLYPINRHRTGRLRRLTRLHEPPIGPVHAPADGLGPAVLDRLGRAHAHAAAAAPSRGGQGLGGRRIRSRTVRASSGSTGGRCGTGGCGCRGLDAGVEEDQSGVQMLEAAFSRRSSASWCVI